MADLIPTASEAEWLEARRKGVTASEIAVLMGLSPYSSPYALYHQKLGILPADDQTPEMEFGTFCEPYIAEKFAKAHPEFDMRGNGRELFAHPERAWQLATPDRLLFERRLCASCDADVPLGCTCESELGDPAAALETKTDNGSDEWGDEGTDEIPVHYRCQVLWQCRVMGVKRWHVACLGRDRKVRFYTGEVGDAAEIDLDLMENEALSFLDRLAAEVPPDVDWRPATAYALKQLHPSLEDRDAHIGRQLEISYRAAVRRHREAERRKDEMTNRLREAMGSANRAVGYDAATGSPIVIATRQVYDLPAKTIERKASTVDKLVPAKPKKES